jgi:hypothetical protein
LHVSRTCSKRKNNFNPKNYQAGLGGPARAPPPALIIYCYSRWQEIYDEIKNGRAGGPSIFNGPAILFNEGLPDLEAIDVEQNTLIILDDLMFEAGRDPKILNIFTTDSHHKNISVIFVTHNIFSNQKHFRTISLNCQYIILTNNPRDRLQITILAKQMFPGESVFFNKAYNDAVNTIWLPPNRFYSIDSGSKSCSDGNFGRRRENNLSN